MLRCCGTELPEHLVVAVMPDLCSGSHTGLCLSFLRIQGLCQWCCARCLLVSVSLDSLSPGSGFSQRDLQ